MIADVELANTASGIATVSIVGEEFLFCLGAFGDVLLNMDRAPHRLMESWRDGDAPQDVTRILDQPRRFHVTKRNRDGVERAFRLPGVLVPQRNIMPAARENHGPGAADEAGSDDRHFHLTREPSAALKI